MFKRWLSIDNKKSCLILGPRRAGKTTLLKTNYPDIPYITLDDFDYLNWANSDPKGLIEHIGNFAIIDEIQRAPKLTMAVKYAIDQLNARFIMTGSSSIGLLDRSADTLAGRINFYYLPTACFGENFGMPQTAVFREQPNPVQLKKAKRLLNAALTYGQFPEVLMQDNNSEKHELLINYRDTYFVRDLIQLSNIENIEGLLAILYHLARSIGSHLEVSNFARESGLSFPTAKKYLNVLYQSQLTFRLYGYQYGPAKRFLKANKTYFADNGIIHSLNINMSDGQLLENFVIAELEKRRKLGYIKTDRFYYYKSAAGREIDLVFELNDAIYAIEIKATANPSPRDVRNLADFSRQMKRPVKCFLFYTGEAFDSIEDARLVPVAALFRGV